MSGPTPSQTVGPFFELGLCVSVQNRLVADSDPRAVLVHGTVADGAGVPVPDAMVEVWQADADGGHPDGFGWGRSGTGADGGWSFVTVKPGPIATAAGAQAPHLSLLVFARGLLKPVLTRMYFPDEQAANEADPLLRSLDPGRRASLVATAEDDRLRFDIHLRGDRRTTFLAL